MTECCKVSECVALAKKRGLCAVHLMANEGPHAIDCHICRKPIERGQFWVRDSEGTVAHPSCINAPPKIQRIKRSWANGFGLLILSRVDAEGVIGEQLVTNEKDLGADAAAVEGAGSIERDAASHVAHTPGPWRTHGSSTVVAENGAYIASMWDEDLDPDGDPVAEAKANAAFIVLAVNSHEELLAALKGTLDYWDTTGFAECEPDCDCIVDSVRAAIQNAEGKP